MWNVHYANSSKRDKMSQIVYKQNNIVVADYGSGPNGHYILHTTRTSGIKDGFSGLDLIPIKKVKGQGQGKKVNCMLKTFIKLSN